MSKANAAKIVDSEKQNLHAAYNTVYQETSTIEKPSTGEAAKPSKMSRIQHFVCTTLFVVLLAFTLVSATADSVARVSISAADKQRFHELLDSVDPVSLHNVLQENVKDKYQQGVYQKDKTAMEMVHKSNADMAYSLIELAKRQASNETVTATATSNVVVTTTATTSSSVEVVTTTQTPTSQPPSTTPIPTTAPTTPPTIAQTQPTTTPVQDPTTAPTTAPVVVPTTSAAPVASPSTTASPIQTTPVPAPSTSPRQSSNGTYYGGPPAYPFAPPISLPSSASHVQNISSVAPTTLPSLSSYVLFSNVSNSSSSPVPTSFTYAPPILTSIPISVPNKTVAYSTPPLSAYAPPVPTPMPYVLILNTSIVSNTSTSLPPSITSMISYTPMPKEPVVYGMTTRSNSTVSVVTLAPYVPAVNNTAPVATPAPYAPAENKRPPIITPAPYGPAENKTAPVTSAAPYAVAENKTSIYSSSYVSDNCTSTSASNLSTSAIMSSPSGYLFNNSPSGASPTSPVAVPATSNSPPSSDSPASSSAGPATQGEASSNVPIAGSPSTLATQTSSGGQSSANGDMNTPSASISSIHSITQQTIETTTLANGKVSTVTRITVVAGQADQTGPGGSPAKTSAAKGSLQTNGARSVKNMGMSGVMGALGMIVVGAF